MPVCLPRAGDDGAMHIRTKLILSYALVIALCLTLAALVSTVLLRRYQQRYVAQRVAIIAEATAPLLHDNTDPARFDAAAYVARTAEGTNTRMLVLSATLRDLTAAQGRAGRGAALPRQFDATVTQDTAGLLPSGARVALPRRVYEDWQAWTRSPAAQAPRAGTPVPLKNDQLTLPEPIAGRVALREGRPTDLVLVPLRAERGAPAGDFRVLVVAEPPGASPRPLAALLGPLGWAAGIAFLASALVALVLARSITGPLLRLTAATRALARGDYAQRVPVHGRDEVAELGAGFNGLAEELARTRRREREVLANISHDLKTPLTSIQGFAGALTDGTCPPEAAPAVGRIIHEEARRMGRLVDDVLHLSRLEAGEAPLALAPLDLAASLRESARRFEGTASAAGVAIRVEVPAEGLWTLGDGGRIEQVLGNLLENALRHTPPGGRIDLVGTLAEDGGGPRARVVVRDTGTGIAAGDLPRIFERFYQADKARAGRGGSGLGLAIAREIVERHGGTIGATSTVGAGTTLTITLPPAPPPAGDGADTTLASGTNGAGTTAQTAARRGA